MFPSPERLRIEKNQFRIPPAIKDHSTHTHFNNSKQNWKRAGYHQKGTRRQIFLHVFAFSSSDFDLETNRRTRWRNKLHFSLGILFFSWRNNKYKNPIVFSVGSLSLEGSVYSINKGMDRDLLERTEYREKKYRNEHTKQEESHLNGRAPVVCYVLQKKKSEERHNFSLPLKTQECHLFLSRFFWIIINNILKNWIFSYIHSLLLLVQ